MAMPPLPPEGPNPVMEPLPLDEQPAQALPDEAPRSADTAPAQATQPATPGATWAAPAVPAEGELPAGMHLGGFVVRVAAYLVDVVIIGVAVLVLAGIISALGLAGGDVNLLASILIVIVVLGTLAYFPYFWVSGATPGQRLFGLRVVDADDMTNISMGQSVMRLVGLWISFLIFYLGVLWVLVDGRKRGWHDLMAGTLVLRRD